MSTKIPWCTDTINPIQDTRKGKSGRGYHCTKCSPGCLNCYAERINKIRGNGLPFDGSPCEFEIVQSELEKLKKWKKHRSIFIQSMGDLFHEDVPFEFIHEAYDKIKACPQHTILVLTKRPERMAEAVNRVFSLERFGWAQGFWSHLWHGLTVCNQQEWNDQGKLFLQIPGKKFLSHEPALEKIDYGEGLKQISCLISGGETGPGARSSHPDIFRSDRDQCETAGIDYFFKSWGEFIHDDQLYYLGVDDLARELDAASVEPDIDGFYRVGKAKAGRMLDSRTHDDLPWAKI